MKKLFALILFISLPALAQDIHVTTLSDSGTGSLRSCMQATGARKCVIDVAGYIDLLTPIAVNSGSLVVAGETAPSPGIHVRGARLEIKAPNVILRHFAVRPGDGAAGQSPGQRDGITIQASDVTLDHMSFTHAIDENFSSYGSGTAKNLKVTNCLIAEALYRSIHPENELVTENEKPLYKGHSMGVLLDANGTSVWNRNIFANNNDRNIRGKPGNQIEFVNNYVFNWGRISGSNMFNIDPGANKFNFVGNVYKRGGSSTTDYPCIYGVPPTPGPSGTPPPPSAVVKVYATDNICPKGYTTDYPVEANPIFPMTITNILPTSNLLAALLPEVGARPWDRFPMDVAILAEVQSGVGKMKDCILQCDTNPDGTVDVPTGPWPVIGTPGPVPSPSVSPSPLPTTPAACPTCPGVPTATPTAAPTATPTPRMCVVPCDALQVLP